jgi:hypothetical protein
MEQHHVLEMLIHTNSNKQVGLATVFALMSLILISYIASSIQTSYAQTATKTLTLNVKAVLDKRVVVRGDSQTIRIKAVDANTGAPIGGAIARATVTYADGVTVRQFATPTDASGVAVISWTIERDTVPGSFSVTYGVSAAAYVTEQFDKTFQVDPGSINGHNNNHHNHHNSHKN